MDDNQPPVRSSPREKNHPPGPQPRNRHPERPWRTEGLPGAPSDDDKPTRSRRVRTTLVWLAVYTLIFAAFTWQDVRGGPVTISYTAFTQQVQARNVEQIYAKGDSIEGTLRRARPVPGKAAAMFEKFRTERPTFAQEDLMGQLEASGATVRATPVNPDRGPLYNMLISGGPLLLLIGFYYWMYRRYRGQLGAMGGMFGGGKEQKPVKPEEVRSTFADVAGIDEVKAEVSEVVDYLEHPDKYRQVGARAPKGVLLTGAPGTGKTLLARATAGEAGVPFFSASASEFIEMIVGVGAQRVRQLFAEARKVAPSIIFIDEIDSIGRSRAGGQSVGGHDEREQTLNQILTEMDGFTGSEGVIVMAATNRPDVLDPALLRAGRFDRTITLNAPDQEGRIQILRVHTRAVPLAEDVDLRQIASSTTGMTGADLANLVNQAALTAARRGGRTVSSPDFFDALERIQLGAARKVVIPPDERRRTAYHEAGHALLGMLQPGADPVRKVSIIPRGRALGVTLSTPSADRYGYDERYLRGRIMGALGGMASEQEVFGVVTTGAESDLQTSTGIARQMAGRWGMSDRVGPVSVLPQDVEPRSAGVSDAMLDVVDDETRRISDECYAEARRVLRENRPKLDAIVVQLLEHETLAEPEIYAAAGIPLPASELPHKVRIPAPRGEQAAATVTV
jgi:cell division protease FtsH